MTFAPPMPRMPGEPPALSLRHLSKRFGGALALNDVSLDVLPGEVLGLLGQNGSGKSTLIKILSGYHDPEPGGELLIHGASVKLPVPAGTTERLGLAFVHQHLGLVPSLTVLENLRIGAIASHTRWWMNWRREHDRARETFARFGLSIDPAARIADLPQVERALVAIVRAFDSVQSEGRAHAGILVLDEPTPFLPRTGVDQLFGLVRAIVREGAAVIFVSHDVDEIREITDRATVLRDGVLAGTLVTKDATHADFVELIVGRRVDLFHSTPRDLSGRPVAAAVRGATGGALRDVSVEIREGEILGLAGLIGSGFDDLPYLIYGANPAAAGTLRLPGGHERPLRSMSPATAIAADIALLPSDRLGAAGVGALSIVDNVSLPVLDEFRSLLLKWSGIFDRALQLGADYQVRPNRPEMKLASLSGGNQQKVLMAKWLQTEPRLLLLDEPTQGVDVGARQHLFAALSDAAARGIAVMVASTDFEQLAQICDRVLIFARGGVVAELAGATISKTSIAEQCLRSAGAIPTAAHAAASESATLQGAATP
jgi:ribose transport system ATP-binding protein